VAYIVMMLLAVKLQLFPSMAGIRAGMDFADQLYRMVLPILTLLLVILAHMVRNTRAAILSVMASPYIEMARLKGEPEGPRRPAAGAAQCHRARSPAWWR
jgi:peptide/nickel transport system permease protein